MSNREAGDIGILAKQNPEPQSRRPFGLARIGGLCFAHSLVVVFAEFTELLIRAALICTHILKTTFASFLTLELVI